MSAFDNKSFPGSFQPATLSVSASGADSSPKGGAKAASPLLIVFQFAELKNTASLLFSLFNLHYSLKKITAGLPDGSPASGFHRDYFTVARWRKVTIWARVQVAFGLNLSAAVPLVILFSTAQRTAFV